MMIYIYTKKYGISKIPMYPGPDSLPLLEFHLACIRAKAKSEKDKIKRTVLLVTEDFKT